MVRNSVPRSKASARTAKTVHHAIAEAHPTLRPWKSVEATPPAGNSLLALALGERCGYRGYPLPTDVLCVRARRFGPYGFKHVRSKLRCNIAIRPILH